MAITGKTRVLGVWGSPVEHSLSPVMQNVAIDALGLNWVYVPFHVDPKFVQSALESIRALDLVGVNATVPLKELIAPHLDWVDPVAAGIKSVNTIVNRGGRLCGYSTDGAGLMWDLKSKNALPSPGGSVLVLGAGGSARAAVYELVNSGYSVLIANRTLERTERLIGDLGISAGVIDWSTDAVSAAVKSASLIINTTTLGMSSVGGSLIDLFLPDTFGPETVLYDLIYSPPETQLMRLVRQSRGTAHNGLGMLIRQGALSLQLWTGLNLDQLPVLEMERALCPSA